MGIYRVSLFTISSSGFLPTLRVLFRLRTLIAYGLPLARSNNTRFIPLNINVVDQLTDLLSGNWGTILTNSKTFLRIYNFVLLPFITLSSFTPLIKFIFKTSFYSIVASLGLIWNITDTGYVTLKYIANHILDFYQNHLDVEIPRPGKNVNLNLPSQHKPHLIDFEYDEPVVNVDNKTPTFFTILTLLVIGITSTITTILIAEYVYPETVHSIPILNSICDCVHATWHYIMNLTTSSNPDPSTGGGSANQGPTILPFPRSEETLNSPSIPEAISRSSSGSSTETVRPFTSPNLDNPFSNI